MEGVGLGGSALQCVHFPNIQPGKSNMVINKVKSNSRALTLHMSLLGSLQWATLCGACCKRTTPKIYKNLTL